MKLLFKERFFSWFDNYDIYDESGKKIYTVEGQLAWGHCLKIYDSRGKNVGTVKERILTFLPRFELYMGENYYGCVSKELTLLRPKYRIDGCDWRVEGRFLDWDYNIVDGRGNFVASIRKELFRLTDTYVIDVPNPADALCALMVVLAIDAEKCSRKD